MRFEILRGLCSHDGVLYGPRDQDGNLGPGVSGNVVETDVDLVARHGAEKFRHVYDSPQPVDPLDDMTVPQLLEYAEEHEVDLGTARKKAELLAAIRGVPQEA